MNLFSSVLRVFGLGKLANPETGAQSSGSASRGTEADIVVSDERALQVSAVWSWRAADLGDRRQPAARLLPHRGGRGPPAAGAHAPALVELFTRRPNGMMTPQEFREAMTCQLALWGNASRGIEWLGDRPSPWCRWCRSM